MMQRKERCRTSRGFSLIEVLIAMALLGAVLTGIMTLFILARKNVHSGRQMTVAATAGTQVLEEISAMTKTGTLTAFNLVTTTPGTAQTVGGQTFANSYVRTTSSISTATDPSGLLNRWRTEILTNKRLKDAVITIVFTPTKDDVNATPVLATATVVKMRVFVFWNETGRNRQIVLDAVKIERN